MDSGVNREIEELKVRLASMRAEFDRAQRPSPTSSMFGNPCPDLDQFANNHFWSRYPAKRIVGVCKRTGQ